MIAIVTGASGLIGSKFIDLYEQDFDKVYQMGRTPSVINLEWIQYDFTSGVPLELPDVDVVFHFAGQTSIYKAKEDVRADFEINVLGTLNLLEALKKQKKPVFVVYAGSATEVGFTKQVHSIDESNCNNPSTFYDISKLTAEYYILQYAREGWIDGCSLRLCNVYGGTKDGQNIDRGVIDKVYQCALGGDPITIFGSGDYLRDYIHIDDVVSAFYAAWKHRNSVNGEYFNIGTGIGTRLYDAFSLVTKLAEQVTGNLVDIIPVDPPEGLYPIEFRSFVADNTKFRDATGWKPKYTLEDGIRFSYRNLFEKVV